jgi:hypothetical protein
MDLFVEESRKSAFKSGERWEVLRREEGAVIVGKRASRSKCHLTRHGSSACSSSRRSLSISDPIRFTKNVKGRGHKFLNNELRTVIDIEDGKIIFDKARSLAMAPLFISTREYLSPVTPARPRV